MRYIVEIGLDPNRTARYEAPERHHWTQDEINYMDGSTRHKPDDFELHVAIHLLERESLPPELLDPIKEWANAHPLVKA